MERNNRITIRINGKDKPIEDRPKKEVPSKKETPTKKDTAAAEEDKEFRWVLPEEKPSPKKVVSLRERQKLHEQRKKKRGVQGAPKLPVHRKKKGHIPAVRKKKKQYALPKKQWLSAFSAVIVGLMMGFVVLTIFTDHHMKSTDTGKSTMTETSTAGNSQTSVPANLDLSLAVIQGGVFSSETSGETAAGNLKDGGFAAVLKQQQGKVYLFIGVGADKSNTETLAKLYKQQGQDVWVKTLSITADTAHLDKNVRTVLGDAKPLMKSLLSKSVSGLTSDQAAFTDNQWNKLNKQYEQLQGDKEKAAKPLIDELKNAMTHAGKYRSQSDQSELWQVQQALLEAALSYQHLAQGKS